MTTNGSTETSSTLPFEHVKFLWHTIDLFNVAFLGLLFLNKSQITTNNHFIRCVCVLRGDKDRMCKCVLVLHTLRHTLPGRGNWKDVCVCFIIFTLAIHLKTCSFKVSLWCLDPLLFKDIRTTLIHRSKFTEIFSSK